MAVELSPQAQAFLKEKVYAHVATVSKSGAPQVTPVWVDTDGKNILFNTADPRTKVQNLRRDPRVAMSIFAPDDPWRGLLVWGKVTEITAEGANEQIDALSLKYVGKTPYGGYRDGETRLKIVVEPAKVVERRL